MCPTNQNIWSEENVAEEDPPMGSCVGISNPVSLCVTCPEGDEVVEFIRVTGQVITHGDEFSKAISKTPSQSLFIIKPQPKV